MQRQRDVAARAAPAVTARPAVDRSRRATSVLEQDGAAARVLDPSQRVAQRPRQRVAAVVPQVDHLHRGQRPAHTPGQRDPPRDAVPGLRPRRGAAEYDQGALQPGPLRGHTAGVVPGIALVLVGGVVLLVHHDHAQPRHRGEHRRAGAHHDPRLAVGDAPVLGAAPGRGERAVQHRHGVAETGLEAGGRLRRQRDLRHQHDRAPSIRQLPLDRPQVDLGLARSGDAVQQHLVRSRPSAPARSRPRPPAGPRSASPACPRRPFPRPASAAASVAAAAPPARPRGPASRRCPRRSTRPDRAGAPAAGRSPRAPASARRRPRRGSLCDRLHDTVHLAGAERHPHQRAAHDVGGELLRHRVVERPVDRPGGDQRLDAGDQTEAGSSSPQASRRAATRSARSQVKAGSSRPKCP